MSRFADNRWCGPFALSHLLEISTGEAAFLIRDYGGRRAIRGTYNSEMLGVLQRLGLHPAERGAEWGRKTLAAFLKGRRGGLYLINVTNHFIIVDGHHIYDNSWRGRNGVSRKDWPHRRKRVVRWWRFDRSDQRKAARKARELFAPDQKAASPRKDLPEVIWRLAQVPNPKTGNLVTLEVTKTGSLVPSDRKRIGVDYADAWDEVRARTRSEARKLIAQGKGTHHTREEG